MGPRAVAHLDLDAAWADGQMVWPDGRTLHLHSVVLCVRAPRWASLLAQRAKSQLEVRGGSDMPPPCVWKLSDSNDGDCGGNGDGDDAALSFECVAPLYRFVVSGWAALPSAAGARAVLAAAEHLGVLSLLLAPPADPRGAPWLQAHMACAVGREQRGVASNSPWQSGPHACTHAPSAVRSASFRRCYHRRTHLCHSLCDRATQCLTAPT